MTSQQELRVCPECGALPCDQVNTPRSEIEECETCEGTGRIECLPGSLHTHPCDDCQPEALKEFNRGYEFAATRSPPAEKVDVEGLKRECAKMFDCETSDMDDEIQRAYTFQTIDYLAASGHLNTAPAPAKEYHLSSGEQAVCRNALRKSVKIKPAPSEDIPRTREEVPRLYKLLEEPSVLESEDRQRALDALGWLKVSLDMSHTEWCDSASWRDDFQEKCEIISTALSTDTAFVSQKQPETTDKNSCVSNSGDTTPPPPQIEELAALKDVAAKAQTFMDEVYDHDAGQEIYDDLDRALKNYAATIERVREG